MGDFQSSEGYNYLFGEADEITRKIEEYRRERSGVDDSPVLVSPEHASELDNFNYQLQSQPTMIIPSNSISFENFSSQDHISHSVYHRQIQNQHTMYNTRHKLCWKCVISMLISWLMRFFKPRPRSSPILTPMPFNASPHSVSESFGDQPDQHSVDEIQQRIQERESENIGGRRETVNVGQGLTKRQIEKLPTIKFKPSIEDKTCMICQSDYAHGDKMTILLPCTHKYHKDCIRHWLQNSKLCCVCQREVVV